MEFFKILCLILFLIAQIFVSILVLGLVLARFFCSILGLLLGLGLPNPILEKWLPNPQY